MNHTLGHSQNMDLLISNNCRLTPSLLLWIFVANFEQFWENQVSQQASYTLHKMNRMKILIENPAMARLRDIFEGWGSAEINSWARQRPPLTLTPTAQDFSVEIAEKSDCPIY